jgi:regulation of enolase protein 1 (concanavalin A-like superfamily)
MHFIMRNRSSIRECMLFIWYAHSIKSTDTKTIDAGVIHIGISDHSLVNRLYKKTEQIWICSQFRKTAISVQFFYVYSFFGYL